MHLADIVKRLDAGTPGRISSVYNNEWRVRTGPEIADDVRGFARTLEALGVVAGMRIDIAAVNSYEWVVADLALMELGCVSLAIPESMDENLEPIAERFGLALVIVDGMGSMESEPSWMVRIRGGGASQAAKATRVGAVRLPVPEARETPSLVFSSGSSGRLKCLRISRAGIENVVRRFVAAYGLCAGDAALVFLPLSNVQQRVIVYGALWFGLEAVVVSPAALFRALRDRRPTVVIGPPLLFETVHARYLDAPLPRRAAAVAVAALARRLPVRGRRALLRRTFGEVHERFGGRLRLAITGMAQIRESTLEFFAMIGLPLFEAYGLTECGIVAGNRPGAARIGAVGRPFEPGAVTRAADGEILVRSETPLATGYHDEPDGADTFADGSLIRTGDMGRFDGDGYLYLYGRKKEIIVTAGGFKIHPEVVESGLNECALVDRSAAFGGEPAADLTAVVTVRRMVSDEDIRTLEEHARRIGSRLPHGVRLRTVVVSEVAFSVDAGTLTRNLKLDRARIYREYRDRLAGMTGVVVVRSSNPGLVDPAPGTGPISDQPAPGCPM
jgi:long-chain acyl-CoA synthetase